MENNATQLIEVLAEATKIPAVYISSTTPASPVIKGMNFTQATKYMDFDEILNFLELTFGQKDINQNTYHTFYTYNSFAYNIVFLGTESELEGAVISGPILINLPDQRLLEHILLSKKLSPSEKPKLISIFESFTVSSPERINYLGRLLYILSNTNQQNCLSSNFQEIHDNQSINVPFVYNKYTNTPFSIENDDDDYVSSYKFIISIKNEITHGNTDHINEIVHKYIKLFKENRTSENNYRILKDICISVCSSSCIYSMQGNASYKRVMPLLKKFISRTEHLSSPDEIIKYMIAILQSLAYEVSAVSNDNYSLHVNQILQYLKIHFADKITLDQLSKHFNLNPVYISSLIKKETKLSLADNINKIRIDESKSLLIYTNKSVHEIAYEVGFNYQNHFNSIFKKHVGITPLEFRRMKGNNNYMLN